MGNRRDFKRDFRNRRRGNINNPNNPNNSQKEIKEKIEENKVIYKCGICQQDIQDLSTAIALPEPERLPAHFDCIIKRIKENENLGEKEQVVYLGSGSFGVVENVSGNQGNQGPNFKIIKKIDFEDKENVPEWRKEMIRVKI